MNGSKDWTDAVCMSRVLDSNGQNPQQWSEEVSDGQKQHKSINLQKWIWRSQSDILILIIFNPHTQLPTWSDHQSLSLLLLLLILNPIMLVIIVIWSIIKLIFQGDRQAFVIWEPAAAVMLVIGSAVHTTRMDFQLTWYCGAGVITRVVLCPSSHFSVASYQLPEAVLISNSLSLRHSNITIINVIPSFLNARRGARTTAKSPQVR